ncbi:MULTISPECIES: TOMM precursor leader peptide-binding protein [Streptomyces]|uniref:TOMM precursor leader peptide-binding protein n=1 Tax=Streptomyces TaxID=1883 RepID=UPI0029CA8DB8|nr:TOMM precursor leader peptide-binding protein [Streptomyces sp. ID01-9D]WSV24800.1 TOMM precursor leader peptide-binding protein [Streptomyces fimicarius]
MSASDRATPAILPIGDFGQAVAQRLRRLVSDPVDIIDVDDVAATGRPVVMAAWRESASVSEALDLSHVPWWLPVVFTHPVVRIGPVFSRDLPGCHACLAGRELSASGNPDHTRSLWDLYDEDQAAGPAGFLPQHAAVAAGLTLSVMAKRRRPLRQLHTYHVLTNAVRTHHFSPGSTCSRWSRHNDGHRTTEGER